MKISCCNHEKLAPFLRIKNLTYIFSHTVGGSLQFNALNMTNNREKMPIKLLHKTHIKYVLALQYSCISICRICSTKTKVDRIGNDFKRGGGCHNFSRPMCSQSKTWWFLLIISWRQKLAIFCINDQNWQAFHTLNKVMWVPIRRPDQYGKFCAAHTTVAV